MCEIKYDLWGKIPGDFDEIPTISEFVPQNKESRAAVIVFPGGAYIHRAKFEGEGYAKMFNSFGITAFVLNYRIKECAKFPNVLSDARRSVQWVRKNAEKYDIDCNKIIVIGSSAGGHLVSQLCTNKDSIAIENADDIDNYSFIPNLQMLCYPVIDFTLSFGETGESYLGESSNEEKKKHSANYTVDNTAPPAFIWHTADDCGVDFRNSLRYADALQKNDVPVELHIFPQGNHGQGMAENNPHLHQWTGLAKNWLKFYRVFE